MKIRESVRKSIVGFKGSKNCDMTSPTNFLASYLKRMRDCQKKYEYLGRHGRLYETKKWKPAFYKKIVDDCEQNTTEIHAFIEGLLKK